MGSKSGVDIFIIEGDKREIRSRMDILKGRMKLDLDGMLICLLLDFAFQNVDLVRNFQDEQKKKGIRYNYKKGEQR